MTTQCIWPDNQINIFHLINVDWELIPLPIVLNFCSVSFQFFPSQYVVIFVSEVFCCDGEGGSRKAYAGFRLACRSSPCRYAAWSSVAVSELQLSTAATPLWLYHRAASLPIWIEFNCLRSAVVGKAARLSIYWQDAACRLVIPLWQVALAQLYKHHQSGNAASGKLVWKQHYSAQKWSWINSWMGNDRKYITWKSVHSPSLPVNIYWRSGTDTFSKIRSVIFCVTKFSYKNCLLESHLPIIMLVL